MRRRVRYRIGVSPYVASKLRAKWYLDTRAARASVEVERLIVVSVHLVTGAPQVRQQVGGHIPFGRSH